VNELNKRPDSYLETRINNRNISRKQNNCNKLISSFNQRKHSFNNKIEFYDRINGINPRSKMLKNNLFINYCFKDFLEFNDNDPLSIYQKSKNNNYSLQSFKNEILTEMKFKGYFKMF